MSDKNIRHFKSLLDINKSEFLRIIERSIELKKEAQSNAINDSLKNKTMAMIFLKNSTFKVPFINPNQFR